MVMSSHPHGSNCNGTTIKNYQPSPISLAPLSFPPSHHCPSATYHAVSQAFPINVVHPAGGGNVPPTLGRVRFSDLLCQYNGAPSGVNTNAVEGLSGSLRRHNVAVIDLEGEVAAIMRCGLEPARLYFRSRAPGGFDSGEGSRGVYMVWRPMLH